MCINKNIDLEKSIIMCFFKFIKTALGYDFLIWPLILNI